MYHVEGKAVNPHTHSFGRIVQFALYRWWYHRGAFYVPVASRNEYRVWVKRYEDR